MHASKYLAVAALGIFIGLPVAAATKAAAQPIAPPAQAPVVATPPAPLTIGELSAQARQRRVAEETAKPVVTTPPPGMTIVPSTQIVTGSAGAAAPAPAKAKPEKKPEPPEFIPGALAIYMRAGARVAELADLNGAAPYRVGQVTPSGWTISAIEPRAVDIQKFDTKTQKQRRLSLIVNPY